VSVPCVGGLVDGADMYGNQTILATGQAILRAVLKARVIGRIGYGVYVIIDHLSIFYLLESRTNPTRCRGPL